MLGEGCGIRCISRLTGLNTQTVCNVLDSAGQHCEAVLNERLCNLEPEFIEIDELFSFVRTKQRNAVLKDDGDQYIYLALDRKSKLVLAHHVARRNVEETVSFLRLLRSRIKPDFVPTISTDEFSAYPKNMGLIFERKVNYGTEKKFFASEVDGERRYSPQKCRWVKRTPRVGMVDLSEINTSHAERLNLTYRLFNKRLARLTLGYSRKLSALRASVALTTAYYNFCRKHSSIDNMTPAMAAGIADHVWSAEELLGLRLVKATKVAA